MGLERGLEVSLLKFPGWVGRWECGGGETVSPGGRALLLGGPVTLVESYHISVPRFAHL